MQKGLFSYIILLKMKKGGIQVRKIWNPWHGCKKCSEGCENCYMYFLDRLRGKDGSQIYKTKQALNHPLSREKNGNYKIKSTEVLMTCMTSDFFLEEADKWRDEVWDIISKRRDVIFEIITKRPQRIAQCLPKGEYSFENIFFNVTCENQKRTDERIPEILKLPFPHIGITCAPLLCDISIEKYLSTGRIEEVSCGGENYEGARECNFDWVLKLKQQCEKYNVTFNFFETGTNFVKNEKKYFIPDKKIQKSMAKKSGASFKGKEAVYKLTREENIQLAFFK